MADSFVPDAPLGSPSFIPDEGGAITQEPASRTTPSDTHGPILGGILDTLGVTGRPGARTPADVLLRPEGLAEHAAQLAVTIPATYLSGAGLGALATKVLPAVAGAAPVIGRVAASAGMGGAEAAARGDSPTMGALIDGVIAALTEGAVSKVSSGAKLPLIGKVEGLMERGAPARAYKWATEAVKEALEPVRARLPKAARLNIPSVSKTPITVDEAVKTLGTLEGDAYQQALQEIKNEMNRLDIQKWIATLSGEFVKGPRPYAGTVYGRSVSPERFAPPTSAKVAEAVRPVVTSPGARSLADIGTTQKLDGGLPAGALPLLWGEQSLGWLGERLHPHRSAQ